MPYVEIMLKEWDLYLKKLGREKILLSELHLGGGTPTFLSPNELKYLLTRFLSKVILTSSKEFSIEVDPRVTTFEHLKTLRELGFIRISLGVQDFDLRVQQAVHRVQSVDQVKLVTDQAREIGFESVNFDLIYGLPFQNLQSIKNTFNEVIQLRPDRIAYYSYAHVPWIKASQRRFTEADLPSGEEKRKLYEMGLEILTRNQYIEIGMDHFALKKDSLNHAMNKGELHRNFMGYTSRYVSPLFGLGVSAIGDAWGAFSQNEKLLEHYQNRIEKNELPLLRGHLLTDEDLLIRKHILNLMTKFYTRWEDAEDQGNFLSQIPYRLAELQEDGLVDLTKNSCIITEEGKPFVRNICMAFDVRLMRKKPDTMLFSQTI